MLLAVYLLALTGYSESNKRSWGESVFHYENLDADFNLPAPSLSS